MVFVTHNQILVATTTIVVALAACTAPQTETSNSDQAAQPNQLEEVANTVKVPPAGIAIDGSSTVYPITDLAAKKFLETKEGGKTKVDVKFSGTSAGFRRFCAGETDISDASRPILIKEIETCNKSGVRFVELPIAFDALTLAVNPKNSWIDSITVNELKKIWQPAAQGKITNWKQVRAGFPDQPLKLFGAGKDSGTFDYFNEVVSGKPKESRMDYTDSEDDNELVAGIEQNPNALGYIPYSYYEANKSRLKALAVDNGKGAILPAKDTVENAKYQPFSRPLFIYVNLAAAQAKPEVRAFVEFYLTNVASMVTSVNYIPLPQEGYRLAKIQFSRGEAGTVFDGKPQTEVTIENLLRRQSVFQLNVGQDNQPSIQRSQASK